ncbi:gamma-tubulin complex component GCP5 [Aspergillus sclerotialis]|uniref:Spindle pole body component n=1 Tax=Aspergillus sclerotialis TaxID=2070753 RepID=A0A3A2ZHK2_9EURO|nr:gamma-tubulin complex component GCP5 [Aspergillus sclerotialis]
MAAISRTNRLKHRAEDTLRASHYARTDQFAVAKQLEGLQEKFQVLNRDELAGGLRTRVDELNEHRCSWFPEILSLLVQLSDRPAQFSSLDKIEKPKPVETEKPLTWTDLDVSGSAYSGDDIWENVDFADESSEDEVSLVFSVDSSPRIRPDSSVPTDEDYVIPDTMLSSGEDENLITSINSAQFWKPANNVEILKHEPSSRLITELQMLKETIFMLQGLPTSVFRRLGENIEVDRRYTLSHLSNEALSSVLCSFSVIGAKIDVLRRFSQVPQSIPYMQTFHRRIEDFLREFDKALSDTQARYLSQKPTVSVSLLQLLDDVRRESRLLSMLSDIVSGIKSDTDKPAQCLDMLYGLVCMAQATGDDSEFRFLADLFLACFETYARPIRLWVERGRLDSREGNFFVRDNGKDGNPRTLWHDWYTLDESALKNTPKFLQPVAHKIFATGKNMVFLQHLNVLPENLEDIKRTSLTFDDIFPESSPSSVSLPFSVLLETAFEKVVDANHSVTSNILRKELDEQCGLWISLQALENIYLCSDMSIFSAIDTKIFELIDRGRGWNDRFLLTELAQTAFSIAPFIEPTGLIVRSKILSNTTPKTDTRSVNILQSISFDYVLPWPVANIITKDSISTYQRISAFLMQIRRAKYAIIKYRLQSPRSPTMRGAKPNKLAYSIRHNMLWFLNTLYNHITELVISTTTKSMRKSLALAKDVDAMIAIHSEYLESLASQCLLSSNSKRIYETVVAILDDCVRFADIQSAHVTPSPSAARRGNQVVDEKDELDDSDSDVDLDSPNANTRTQTQPANLLNPSTYDETLKSLKSHFTTHISSIGASLKEAGRVNGNRSWEVLGEKLELGNGWKGRGI